MGDTAIPAAEGWAVVEELLEDERVEFAAEPMQIESVLAGLLAHRIPAGKLVSDANLAAFAIRDGRRLATLDRGFRQFRGLEVELIGSRG